MSLLASIMFEAVTKAIPGTLMNTIWYSEPLSSYDCNDADPVQVWVGVETQNIDFQLNSGGSISGRLVDERGQPLGNVKVEYDSAETSAHWYQAWSDPADGTFTLDGVGVGHSEITIISDPMALTSIQLTVIRVGD